MVAMTATYNETGYEPYSEREEKLLVQHACVHAQRWLLALTFSDSRLMPSSMSIKEDILVCSFCFLWIEAVKEVCEVHTCLMPTSTSVWLSESSGDLPMPVTIFPKG